MSVREIVVVTSRSRGRKRSRRSACVVRPAWADRLMAPTLTPARVTIGLALIESLCIYALVVALILIFAHPQAASIAALFAK
ncbi:MAG: hypothetical protein WCD88_12925 [Desulfobacterales bacterium]